MRADQLLVARGLAASRARARELIQAGAVSARIGARDEVLRKPSVELAEDTPLAVEDGAGLRYASRGGLKLAGALDRAHVDARGLACLDLGQSTGGFTDCLLQAGAARVVGVDVGHGQLRERLRHDPRVRAFEGVNVRTLAPEVLGAAFPPAGFDLVVADLSFISLVHALGPAHALTRPGGRLLALVKPQFEVGPGGVDRHGIVRDPALYETVRRKVCDAAACAGWTVDGWFESPIRGGDGNREFFLCARK
ncbi:MAG: TlyA family RNA methyltransferase [Burkholderiaceae bacterium]|nr:TlyA family RNA methyltransferase [Burkholderiaceae bacterium]